MPHQRKLAAIMFTDIVGYTALMGEDEDSAYQLLKKNRQIQQPVINKHEGIWLKEMGDGNLASFSSAIDAVNCAKEIQQLSSRSDITLRIGIHVGDVTMEENDVIGDVVNIASRIESMADPGGIYISESVQKAVRGNKEIEVNYIGEVQLKNVDFPTKIYALRGGGLPVTPDQKIKSLIVHHDKRSINWIQNTVYVALTIALILTLFWFKDKQISSPIEKNNKAIAVLPIKNTGDSLENYFAYGISNELTSEFSKIQALRVWTIQSTKKYENTMMSMPEIAAELNVDFLVDASIQKVDNKIEVKVKLIELKPYEDILWSDVYIEEHRNIYSLYNDLIKDIIEIVEVPLRHSEEINLAMATMVDPVAHDAYLKGIYFKDRLSEEGLDLAEKYFNLAIEKDPDFALAYVGLFLTWGGRMQSGLIHPSEGLPRANDAAMKALQIDNNMPEIHFMLAIKATWTDWGDWESAGQSFEKTLDLNPNHAMANAYYAHYLNIINKPNDALNYAEKAFGLDPFNPLMHGLYGQCLRDRKEYDKAIEVLTAALEDSNDGILLATLQSVYHMKGMHEEALELWIQLYEQLDDAVAVEKIKIGAAEGGYVGALEEVALLFEQRYKSGKQGYIRPWSIGTKYTRS
ncbi:MAG: tetratricopeptide repeat protein, partial [Cyclobacteriaceae bacterium]|nr:tetratricopeptide repeat protein [Cyclobacteriaceae bacterium]